jgi:hypothetical protein
MMSVEDFREMDEFFEAYRTIPYSSIRSDFNTSLGENRYSELHGLYIWLRHHYEQCKYFNGFSIAKPPRDRRGEEVVIRCSCGDSTLISSSLWRLRIRDTDIEDIIEDLNYRCRNLIGIKERFEHDVSQEILRRNMMEEMGAKSKRKDIEKKGLNPILGLDVQD